MYCVKSYIYTGLVLGCIDADLIDTHKDRYSQRSASIQPSTSFLKFLGSRVQSRSAGGGIQPACLRSSHAIQQLGAAWCRCFTRHASIRQQSDTYNRGRGGGMIRFVFAKIFQKIKNFRKVCRYNLIYVNNISAITRYASAEHPAS